MSDARTVLYRPGWTEACRMLFQVEREARRRDEAAGGAGQLGDTADE